MKSDNPEDMLKALQENGEKWFAQIGDGVDEIIEQTKKPLVQMVDTAHEYIKQQAEIIQGLRHDLSEALDTIERLREENERLNAMTIRNP